MFSFPEWFPVNTCMHKKRERERERVCEFCRKKTGKKKKKGEKVKAPRNSIEETYKFKRY